MGTLIENDNPGGVEVPLFTDDGKVNTAELAELDVLRPLIVPSSGKSIAKALRAQGANARATKRGFRITAGKRNKR